MALDVAVVMDPISHIKIGKDTSFAMMLEARRRGHRLHYVPPGGLSLDGERAMARMAAAEVRDDPADWVTLGPMQRRPLAEMDVVLVRTDPPFDANYLYDTHILGLAQAEGVLVANDPQGLRDLNEKLGALLFPQCCPPTRVSRDAADLRAFVAEHGEAVLKPLDGMGGRSIFRVRHGDPNLNVILETLTDGGRRLAMAQRYLPEIVDGDKRDVAGEDHVRQVAVDEAGFGQMVARAKDYIAAGDIFQVVLSHRFSAPWTEDSFAFYRSLRRQNPSPYLFYLNFEGFQLAGSSPEILVRLKDGRVTIRPLAGTRPRGETPEADRALEAELLADPKERAEHLMLLDLGRNDVGRVAAPGTVEVIESFRVERYSSVMHIVSEVQGDARRDLDAVDALLAALPAGTLSGAPKVRAMQIIDELETTKRGVGYGGGVGYISAGGEADICITLRTALFADDRIFVQAGAGVVADSDPAAEYAETRHKARAPMRAADDAWRFRTGNR